MEIDWGGLDGGTDRGEGAAEEYASTSSPLRKILEEKNDSGDRSDLQNLQSNAKQMAWAWTGT